MVEALGMAGMTETPLVVVESQRAGPSTGLPTKTEQGDLNLMLGAGQGDFPRAILAPPNRAEAYRATIEAFELAEDWQTPILLASDLHLSENYMTVDRDGASDWTVPLRRPARTLAAERPRSTSATATPTPASRRARSRAKPGSSSSPAPTSMTRRATSISDVKSGSRSGSPSACG